MAEIPTGDWSWINEAAERFEQAWKKGPRPRIEDFLAEEPEPRRPPLLSELLRVECELRVKAGERPNAEEYRRRFPEHDDVVASVFAPAPTATGRPSLSPTGSRRDYGNQRPAEHATPGTCQPSRLRDHPRAGARRHGRRLPRPQPNHGTRRGAEGHRTGHHRATRRVRPLSPRDPRCRQAPAPQYRHRPRRLPLRREPRFRHGVRRGPRSGPHGQGQGPDAGGARLLLRAPGGAGLAARRTRPAWSTATSSPAT